MKATIMYKAFQLLWPLIILSCSEKQSSGSATNYNADSTSHAATEERIFDIPVIYKNWEFGSHENTRTVLKMYQAWNQSDIKSMEALLADTVTMDLPDSKRREAPRDKMISELVKARKDYLSTLNDIIAAYPIHNIDKNEDWVNVLVYSKWVFKDKTKDSMLYQDLWKVKNGKISYLLTLEQTPSRLGTRQLNEMIGKK
jgi:ketosteroid isomerase-like protein